MIGVPKKRTEIKCKRKDFEEIVTTDFPKLGKKTVMDPRSSLNPK